MKLFCAFWLGIVCLTANSVLGAAGPETFKVSEFSFKRPATWDWVETASPMRKAQLKIWDAKKEKSGEVVFFYFGEGNGGGTAANVDRWLGQFQEPRAKINSKVEDAKVGNQKITYVQAEGTYKSGMPGGPQTPMAGTMLMGAILESEQGNVFVKLTAPVSLAKSARDDFRKMVESVTK